MEKNRIKGVVEQCERVNIRKALVIHAKRRLA
jgi:hypothetical protein